MGTNQFVAEALLPDQSHMNWLGVGIMLRKHEAESARNINWLCWRRDSDLYPRMMGEGSKYE